MKRNSFSIYKLDSLPLIKILTFEVGYWFVIYYGYALFSMLFFGEGDNSFMYTETNHFIHLGLIFIPITFFNLYQFLKFYRQKLFLKSNYYLWVQLLLTITFIWFVVVIEPIEL
ncbi:magnesium-transporting ATPase (P-type) [Arcicella rosea]|uniref:Magnesium-transporting ATPase (P-type) n=1 Tax=Arcicella rosea TaxID=502909 RepID=A0A841ET10_9BACT|nr:magnesium-transporting ATPase (P-type) [Arcicella rosea]